MISYVPKINIQGVLLKDPEKAMSIFNKEFQAAMWSSLFQVEREAKLLSPINQGTYRNSIMSAVSGSGLDLTGRVGTPILYAEPIEYGQKAHFPNLDNIKVSARFKFGALANDTLELQRAYAIAKSIARRGVRAFEVFKKSFEKSKKAIDNYFQSAGLKITQELSR